MKHIVLLESDIHSGATRTPLHQISESDCKIEYQLYLRADDVIFLTDDNTLYSFKCRHTEYSGSRERKNYEFYRDRNIIPNIITPEQKDFLGELLRLHHDTKIILTTHEFHTLVLTLYREWYPTHTSSKRNLNKLRTKYKSFTNDNKSKRSNWKPYI
jgi:hypothetical protein